MEFHRIAHRLFLLLMFIACSIAVLAFARNRVEASLINNLIQNSSETSSDPIVTEKEYVSPLLNQASSGAVVRTDTANNTNTNTNTVSSDTSLPGRVIQNSTEDEVSPVVNDNNVDSTSPLIDGSGIKTDVRSEEIKTTTQDISNINRETSITPNVATQAAVQTNANANNLQQPASTLVAPTSTTEKIIPKYTETSNDIVNSQPILMKTADINQEKNPKISGEVAAELRVERVEMMQKQEGGKSIYFKGRALPDALVTLYVFSEDPIVITVKADENGDWSYELTKDLENGQHEVYVAVVKDDGKIVSKSQPLAFVKTAQAATAIPYSEFEANKSPMQKSAANYVLTAIMIILVCLVIALALIGVITHKKYKTDETFIQ